MKTTRSGILHGASIAAAILSLPACVAATAPAANEPPAAQLRLEAPADGAVFSAPADIRVRGVVQYALPWVSTVTYSVGDGKLGTAHADIPIAALLPPDAPVSYPFRWRDVQPGEYSIAAEARLADGATLRAEPVSIRVEAPEAIEPTLEIRSPEEGATLPAGSALEIAAVGFGRHGGVTDVGLRIDGELIDESHIAFIRAPEAYETVAHSFAVAGLKPGAYRLEVVDLSTPGLVSAPVNIRVVEAAEARPGLLRLSPLADGTLLLVLDPGQAAGRSEFEIQSSSDLQHWTVIGRSEEGFSGPVPRAAAPPQLSAARFLRAVRVP